MRTSITQNKTKKIAFKNVACIALWVVLWQLVADFINLPLLVSSPLTVLQTLQTLVVTADFWLSISKTLLSVLGGFCTALVLGTVLAGLCAQNDWVKCFVGVPMTIIKATPVASFIILALIWIKSAYIAWFICLLMVLPTVYTNVLQGVYHTDQKLIELGQCYGFSRKKMLAHIYVPSVMPYFTAAVTSGLGLAWKAGVSAEILGLIGGTIGKNLYDAKIYLETEQLFAWTVVIILLSLLIEYALKWLLMAKGRAKDEHSL